MQIVRLPRTYNEITTEYAGLAVRFTFCDAGYEGDPSIPNGTRQAGYEIEDISVYTNEDEITHMLSKQAMEHVAQHCWNVVYTMDFITEIDE